MGKCFCIDMGGTTIKYGVVDETLAITKSGKIPTNVANYEELLEDLAGIIRPHVADCEGISFSIPGAIDAKAGTIANAGAIFCLCDQPLREDLTKLFGLPIVMENDANCAGLAEFYSGAGKGTDNMVMIALGTGIGGAIIVNGQLLHTKHNFSGEFGFMVVDSRNQKTWDKLSGSVVRVIEKIQSSDESLSQLNGAEIFDLYHKHPVVTEHLEEFFHLLATGCYTIEAMLDPDMIIIGGGISSRDDFIDNLTEAMGKLHLEPQVPVPPVVKVAEYRNHANLIGAYHHMGAHQAE